MTPPPPPRPFMCPLLTSQPLQKGSGEELYRVHPCGQELCLLHRRGEPLPLGFLGQPEPPPTTPRPTTGSGQLHSLRWPSLTPARWVWEKR